MVRLNRTRDSSIDIFFILALLALFAITSFATIMIGAKQYHTIANRMSMNYETRTAVTYLVEKFRQHDATGSVAIVDIEGTPAISLTQTANQTAYITYIYAYNGYLKECTVSEDTPVTVFSGQNIIEAADLSIKSFGGNLYCFTLTDTYGNSNPIYISLNAK